MENFEIRQNNQHIKHTLPASKTAEMLIVVSSSKIEEENKYSYRLYVKKDILIIY